MNDISAWSLKFSKEELYLVAGMLQAGSLLGFEDPFLGQLADSVDTDLAAAQSSLQNRGYLLQQTNGDLVLDSGEAAMVKAITTSDNILIAVSTFGEETSCWFYHFAPGLLVEQLELPNGDIILTAIQNIQELCERMRMLFALKATPTTKEFPSFTITKNDLSKARQLVREDPDLDLVTLVAEGVPAKATPSILSALEEGRFIDSLIVLKRGENGMEYGKTLNWLYGSDGIWLVDRIDSGDQATFEMCPTSFSKLQNELKLIAEPLLSQTD